MKPILWLAVATVVLIGLGTKVYADVPTKPVFRTVISHLMKADLGIYPEGNTLYVSRVPINAKGRLNEAQLQSDFDGKPIPDGIVASFRRENTNARIIPEDRLATDGVTLGDFSPVGDFAFSEATFPDSKALVNFYMPAYSADKDFALIRLILSPTAHGSTGTYLLKRDSKSWKDVWFKLAFYM